jgi:hypothetical protein
MLVKEAQTRPVVLMVRSAVARARGCRLALLAKLFGLKGRASDW